MDTCLADIWGAPAVYCKPAIVIFDLKTDTLIKRYELKPEDATEESFFANIVSIFNSCFQPIQYLIFILRQCHCLCLNRLSRSIRYDTTYKE